MTRREERREALDLAFMRVLDVDLDGVVMALRLSKNPERDGADGL